MFEAHTYHGPGLIIHQGSHKTMLCDTELSGYVWTHRIISEIIQQGVGDVCDYT